MDSKAASAQPPLPPIDSLDVWELVTGANRTSPRTVLPVDAVTIVVGRHKLIQTDPEAPHGLFVPAAGWTGPQYPNTTTLQPNRNAGLMRLDCRAGCLFDLESVSAVGRST